MAKPCPECGCNMIEIHHLCCPECKFQEPCCEGADAAPQEKP